MIIGIGSCEKRLDCTDFKTGNFYIPNSVREGRTIRITRTKNSQVEVVDNEQTRYGILEWIDDCTYRLTFDETKMELNEFQKYINSKNGIIVSTLRTDENCLYYSSIIDEEGESSRIDGILCRE